MNRGAIRMVLIRSGGYDYAELELSNPVHLVAANNAGKTTLINALQFLYIDNFSDMHFPLETRTTKEHYFPLEGSLLLFECLTPTGLQVLAFRGLGPVQGHDYERLIYSGAYERSDFADGARVRPWSEVNRRLIAREMRAPLSASNVRASLISNGDTKGPPLGLVPLSRPDNYSNFRFLFRNLVTLSRIDQEKLKSLFVDISLNRLAGTGQVDLRSSYTESYRRITEGMKTIAGLQRIEEAAGRLEDQYELREQLRATLVGTWRALKSTFAQHQANDHHQQQEFLRKRHELEDGVRALEKQLKGFGDQAARLNAEKGRLEGDVSKLEALRDRVKDLVPTFEVAERDALSNELDQLLVRLRDVTRVDATIVAKDLRDCRTTIANNTQLLERHTDAIATWLRTNSGLPPSALDQVFRVLDPHLLTGVVGDEPGDVVIEDAERLIAAVRQVHAHFTPDGFAGAGVRVPQRALSNANPLTATTDVDALEQLIKRDRARLRGLEQLQQDVEARQQLEQHLTDLKARLSASNARVSDLNEWEDSEPTLVAHAERLEAIQVDVSAIDRDTTTLREQQVKLRLDQQKLDQQVNASHLGHERALADMRTLTEPPLDWPEADEAPDVSRDLAVLIGVYRKSWGDQIDAARKVEELLDKVSSEAGVRYVGPNVSETIATLHSELEALPERIAGVKSDWMSLVSSMRSAFKGLVTGVDEIQRQVTALNRALDRRRISNLAQVELVLTTQQGLLKQLRGVLVEEDAPLFGEGEDAQRSKATQEVAGWLENRPVIRLLELFDLRFRVVDRRGHERTFMSLNQIESKGTSTTIKVLVHLELMRLMLVNDGVSVPFVLDEVAELDEANLRNLIAHASAMGFVPVVASPQPSDAVDTIYFLPEGGARSTLTQANRVIIERPVHAPT